MDSFIREKGQKTIRDSYDLDIEQKTLRKDRQQQINMQNEDMQQSDQSTFRTRVEYGKQRVMNAIKLWSSAFFILGFSSLLYPVCVRFSRKVFRIKGFINIHFSIFPMIVNLNCISLGIINGCYNSYVFHSVYNDKS